MRRRPLRKGGKKLPIGPYQSIVSGLYHLALVDPIHLGSGNPLVGAVTGFLELGQSGGRDIGVGSWCTVLAGKADEALQFSLA